MAADAGPRSRTAPAPLPGGPGPVHRVPRHPGAAAARRPAARGAGLGGRRRHRARPVRRRRRLGADAPAAGAGDGRHRVHLAGRRRRGHGARGPARPLADSAVAAAASDAVLGGAGGHAAVRTMPSAGRARRPRRRTAIAQADWSRPRCAGPAASWHAWSVVVGPVRRGRGRGRGGAPTRRREGHDAVRPRAPAGGPRPTDGVGKWLAGAPMVGLACDRPGGRVEAVEDAVRADGPDESGGDDGRPAADRRAPRAGGARRGRPRPARRSGRSGRAGRRSCPRRRRHRRCRRRRRSASAACWPPMPPEAATR